LPPSPLATPTPPPYFRTPRDGHLYSFPSSNHFSPPVAQPFFKDSYEPVKQPSFYPKSESSLHFPSKGSSLLDFPATSAHDEHMKNFPLGEYHLPGLEEPHLISSPPTSFPSRSKKKMRNQKRPSKSPNFFEKYLNAFRGIKLPKLPGLKTKGHLKKEKTRKKSFKKKKKKKSSPLYWPETEAFQDEFDLYSGNGGSGFEEIQELPLHSLEGPQFDYYS